MNKRHYEHTLPNIRGSLSNTYITMKQEIRQNGKTVLYSGDGHSIPMIFNNLVGKNLKGREYSDYIVFVAIPDMGFTYGKIEYYSDGNLIATGEITP